ncbi:tetratricopeptide repeat-containing glycosyltransferase family 2 protein [Clostridium magnum]|uniref:SPBc2 prophage-derived glycosyltransferase SunS n=1 Tax=Clostridium magnum DSM 2767 TaxID=1121326 RepID=A0A162UAJ5_9CLOT|nr:glycosyltransferase family 2 protein [Clostridium magnum]KZL93705.1 SPBc2 prophage-derived glycosyltransferase SunS [Clostridium magnum DSM 2767]SHI10036.1 Tetratricopeptide repeat-containing protein [Clostridium magnum DSM 2767]
MTLGLCMIVKNEEENLPRCLESIKDIVDEIIIVDTGSTDSTVKIAESYGAKVFFYEWDNSFANARNFSLEKSSKDWILIMDADDELRREDRDKVIYLVNDKNNNVDIYFGETLSYVGETPGSDIYTNLNVRFIKNGKGIKFKGDIHEQIVFENKGDNVQLVDVKFYHYGYLNKTVEVKNKRKRNMEIIQKILKDNPKDSFMLYNMGTEYVAMGNFLEALNCYKKSYENFNPHLVTFNSKLILKMIYCYEVLGQFKEEIELINEGLKYYPEFTELEFRRAMAFYNRKKYDLAVEALKKCIDMGEPPAVFRDLSGVGSYRAYYLMGLIHFDRENYDDAYKYLDMALKLNSKFTEAILKISQIMFIKNFSVDEIESKLESYFNGNLDENNNLLLSDIFYSKNKFDIAYKYADRSENYKTHSPKVNYYKGILLFYQRKFKEALDSLAKVELGGFYSKSVYYSILCEIFNNQYSNADKLLDIAKNFNENEKTIVYKTFKDIMQGNKYSPIAEDKESSIKFLHPIFDLLEIILKSNSFDEFEKAVQLLNLINDDSILLLLGKLYYKKGYFEFAYKEFIRSIKIYEKIDIEALEMMKLILTCKEI